ncbi:hypothetical protein ACFPRL_31900 [Pseudoclavibacter helvolus]
MGTGSATARVTRGSSPRSRPGSSSGTSPSTRRAPSSTTRPCCSG